jgi:squalene synthase HpnC
MTASAANHLAGLESASPEGKWDVAAANRYCRDLAERHYENFTVASCWLHRRYRQHFCNLYAFCRLADDRADETGDHLQSLRLLADWRSQLGDCFAGTARHPAFVALRETIRQFALPREPFEDLLSAFEQDQQQVRYETFEDLRDYCRRSANPVGRLVLCLLGERSPTAFELSDAICTGLQWANFCQDVAADWQRGRIYLPQQSCRSFGYTADDFAARRCNTAFRGLLAQEVARAERLLESGRALIGRVPDELQIPIDLFRRGGLAILRYIRRQLYDVWTRRPTVSRGQKLRLVLAAYGARWVQKFSLTP